jgi:hypothetical protein
MCALDFQSAGTWGDTGRPWAHAGEHVIRLNPAQVPAAPGDLSPSEPIAAYKTTSPDAWLRRPTGSEAAARKKAYPWLSLLRTCRRYVGESRCSNHHSCQVSCRLYRDLLALGHYLQGGPRFDLSYIAPRRVLDRDAAYCWRSVLSGFPMAAWTPRQLAVQNDGPDRPRLHARKCIVARPPSLQYVRVC